MTTSSKVLVPPRHRVLRESLKVSPLLEEEYEVYIKGHWVHEMFMDLFTTNELTNV